MEVIYIILVIIFEYEMFSLPLHRGIYKDYNIFKWFQKMLSKDFL